MVQYATLATCALDQWALDFEGNLGRMLEASRRAKEKGARYLLFPELCTSGYNTEDHFLELDTFAHSAEVVAQFVVSGGSDGLFCDIGLPVIHRGVSYNARLFIVDRKVLAFRPKMYLAADGNYRETRFFSRWSRIGEFDSHRLHPSLKEVVRDPELNVPFGDISIDLADTRLSTETCEELFTPQSPNIYLGLGGVEIIGNGSGSHWEIRKLERRVELIRSASDKSGGIYLYSNQIGCDGGRLLFDGCAMIAVNGKIVAQGSQFNLTEVEVLTATVDLEEVRSYRVAIASRGVQAAAQPPLNFCKADFYLSQSEFSRRISRPINVKIFSPQEEIAYGPACWLWDYMRRSGASGFFLPLSGGADSSSTATIVGAMCQMVCRAARAGDAQVLKDVRRITGDPEYTPEDPTEFANRIMHSAYLGTSNSSEGTRTFARELAATIGNYHLDVNMDSVVKAMLDLFVMVTGKTPKFRAHSGTFAENQALQNIQARLRMVFSYLLAQLLPWVRGSPGWLLVLGSGNVDEALRGYLTKYDCSSADLNPIGGVAKVDLKRFLYWASTPEGLGYPILRGIADQPPTAELEPITDEYTQQDEADMGMTYEELSIYGRLRKVSRCGPVSMFKRLIIEWPHLAADVVGEKVKFFFKMYTQNRHKLTTLTPSVHCESYSPEDNRFDLRPIFINPSHPWAFRIIDNLTKELMHKKSSNI